jgi:hypothetical protein
MRVVVDNLTGCKPNAQAALLINLVKRYPDTVEWFATI